MVFEKPETKFSKLSSQILRKAREKILMEKAFYKLYHLGREGRIPSLKFSTKVSLITV
jgi:hypothetical protein